MGPKFDFSGWATRNDLRCSDGRTIRKDAFKDNDGQTVPLVWQHRHDDPTNVLGHALLENRDEGVYAYCSFNETDWGQYAKALVQHGDITSLSIYANQLQQRGGDVLHGAIKEVSLVLAGANPGAYIDNPVLSHSDGTDEPILEEAMIFSGEEGLELSHADSEEEPEDDNKEKDDVKTEQKEKTVKDVFDEFTEEQKQVVYFMIGQALEEAKGGSDDDDEDTVKHSDDDDTDEGNGKEKTVKQVFDSLTEEQKQVVYFMIGQALEDAKTNNKETEVEHSDLEGDDIMKHNVFDAQTAPEGAFLSHADEMQIIADARDCGSFKKAFEAYAAEHELAHADDDPTPVSPKAVSGFGSYIVPPATAANIDLLFPEFRNVRPGAPEIVTNDQAWVKQVLGKVHRTPYSRIRTSQNDLREIEGLRAKGATKGMEKALVAGYNVALRDTSPTTVFVKSALNRDDIIDIVDFSYVDYQYGIDRMLLEKELARAILIGDGRAAGTDGRIDPEKIRPIWLDNELFSIHKLLTLNANANGTGTAANFGDAYRYAEAVEELLLDAKVDYRGSGAMDMFCTQAFYNKMLLAKDRNGRRIYTNKNELNSALDVNNVFAVPEFATQTRTVTVSGTEKTYRLLAIVGNLADYSVGATKGGEITHFEQFDIDFNQMKSLIETRVSGATTRIKSFIVIEEEVT